MDTANDISLLLRKALENKETFTYRYNLMLGDAKVESVVTINPTVSPDLEKRWTGKYVVTIPQHSYEDKYNFAYRPSDEILNRKIKVYVHPEITTALAKKYYVYRYRISTAKAHTISEFKINKVPLSCVGFQLVSGDHVLGRCKPPSNVRDGVFKFFKEELPIESVYMKNVELKMFTEYPEMELPKITVEASYNIKKENIEFQTIEAETSDGVLMSLSYNDGMVVPKTIYVKNNIPESTTLLIDYVDRYLKPEILLAKYSTF